MCSVVCGESLRVYLEYYGYKMNSPYRERRSFTFRVAFEPGFSREHVSILERNVCALKMVAEFLSDGRFSDDVWAFPHGYPGDLGLASNVGGSAVVYVSRKTGSLMANVVHNTSRWETDILWVPDLEVLWLHIVRPSGVEFDIFDSPFGYQIASEFFEVVHAVVDAAFRAGVGEVVWADWIGEILDVGTVDIRREEWKDDYYAYP